MSLVAAIYAYIRDESTAALYGAPARLYSLSGTRVVGVAARKRCPCVCPTKIVVAVRLAATVSIAVACCRQLF